MDSDSGKTRRLAPMLWGALGGSAYGAVEVVRVVTSSRLDAGPVAVAGLAAGALSLGIVGAIGVLLIAWLPGVRRTGPIGLALLGGGAASVVAFGAWWLGDPAPWSVVLPFRGNPWVVVAYGFVGLVGGVAFLRQSTRAGRVVALIAALLVAGAAALLGEMGPPAVSAADRPNVLVISIDGARADRFDDGRVHTGAADRVGLEGVRFTRAFANTPYSGPGAASLLAGTSPWESGALLDGQALSEPVTTLPMVLREQGWRTAAFVSALPVARGLGHERGFEVYDDDFAWLVGSRDTTPGRLWRMYEGGRDLETVSRRGEDTVDRALRWFEEAPGPWFAWVHLADPLPPFEPPPPYDNRYYSGADPRDPTHLSLQMVHPPEWMAPSLVGLTDLDYVLGRYDGEVAYADAQAARVLDWLGRSGQAEHTIVVITGTHGLALGEDDRWFVHDGLSDGEIRVPLVIRAPGLVSPGRVVEDPVELPDIAPTLLSWLEVPAPASWSGVSLAEVARGGSAPRAVARSLAYEVDIPRADATAWRVAAVRNRSALYLLHEDPAKTDRFVEHDADTGGLLRDLLTERARALLRGAPQDPGVLTVSPLDAELLDQRGFRPHPERFAND